MMTVFSVKKEELDDVVKSLCDESFIKRSETGKPYLITKKGLLSSVNISLASKDDWYTVAISDNPIGIDMEAFSEETPFLISHKEWVIREAFSKLSGEPLMMKDIIITNDFIQSKFQKARYFTQFTHKYMYAVSFFE